MLTFLVPCWLLFFSSLTPSNAFASGGRTRPALATMLSATMAEPSLTPKEEKVYGFLEDLRNKDFRIIVIGNGAILESTHSLGPNMSLSQSPKSGANLVTFASPDKSFELHLQTSQVAKVALVEKEMPGRTMRILRLSNEQGQSICSLIVSEDSEAMADWFQSMRDKYGEEWQV